MFGGPSMIPGTLFAEFAKRKIILEYMLYRPVGILKNIIEKQK
jgi:hypothetical protein